MPENETPETPADPFAGMIKFYETWSKAWAGVLSESASSERFAEAMGQQMDTSLDSFAQAKQQFGEWMDAYLGQMNLPTRTEVIKLAERMTAVEIKLDDIDAKLDEVLDALRQ